MTVTFTIQKFLQKFVKELKCSLKMLLFFTSIFSTDTCNLHISDLFDNFLPYPNIFLNSFYSNELQ